MPVVLVIEADAPGAEALSDRLLELGAPSVEIEDAEAGTPGERALFDEPGCDAAAWQRWRLRITAESESSGRRLLGEACTDLGLAVPPASIEPLEDEDWVRKTQAQFAPIRISERLWITPSWHRAPDAHAIEVVIDPGLAFGTGSHPTTLLCLEWLDREVRGGETLIDYGCGSGILAIAARKLGAAAAIGLDIDPQALQSARENARRNDIECDFRHADAALEVRADLVVANILANPLVVLAPAISRLVRPGGKLALSGVLAGQAGEVADAYARWFELQAPAERDGWVRITGTRRSLP